MILPRVLATLLFTLSLILIACEAGGDMQGLQCNDLVSPELQQLAYNEMMFDDFTDWVSANYDVTESALEHVPYDAPSRVYTSALVWEDDQHLYSGAFIREALQTVGVDWKRHAPRPTVAEIVECAGFPSHVSALFLRTAERGDLKLYLWYQETGVIVIAQSSTFAFTPPPASSEARVLRISYTTPGTVEQMLQRGEAGNGVDLEALILQAAQPWPGSWEAVRVLSQ